MRAQLADLFVRAQHETRELGEAGKVGAGVRRGDERDAARPAGDRLPSLDAEAGRMTEDLLGENAAHAVGDEDDRTLADAFVGERLEDRRAAIGERHRLAGPGRDVGVIAERPHADVRKVGRRSTTARSPVRRRCPSTSSASRRRVRARTPRRRCVRRFTIGEGGQAPRCRRARSSCRDRQW